MKLGVMAVLFGDKDLKWVCDYLVSQGVQTIEIGCGGYPGKSICDPEVLLKGDSLRLYAQHSEKHHHHQLRCKGEQPRVLHYDQLGNEYR